MHDVILVAVGKQSCVLVVEVSTVLARKGPYQLYTANVRAQPKH